MLQKEAEKGKKEVEVVISEVASPGRVEEPEPHRVAEPLERMSGIAVAEDEEDVWVAPVAKPAVAESRVAVVVDEDGGPSAIGVPVSEGKRRRVDDSSEEGGDIVEGVVVPTGPRGGAPMGTRLMADRVAGVRRGSGVPADLFVRRAYRFVDRSLVGVRNGMVGDSYQTRGSFARAPFVGRGEYRGRGYRPYR